MITENQNSLGILVSSSVPQKSFVSFRDAGEMLRQHFPSVGLPSRNTMDSTRLAMQELKELKFNDNMDSTTFIIKEVRGMWNIDLQVANAETKHTTYVKYAYGYYNDRGQFEVRDSHNNSLPPAVVNNQEQIERVIRDIPSRIMFYNNNLSSQNIRKLITKIYDQLGAISIRAGVVFIANQQEKLDKLAILDSFFTDNNTSVLFRLYTLMNDERTRQDIVADINEGLTEQMQAIQREVINYNTQLVAGKSSRELNRIASNITTLVNALYVDMNNAEEVFNDEVVVEYDENIIRFDENGMLILNHRGV
jgi:hypothetical protein